MRYAAAAAACLAILVVSAIVKLVVWGPDGQPGAIPLLLLFVALIATWCAIAKPNRA